MCNFSLTSINNTSFGLFSLFFRCLSCLFFRKRNTQTNWTPAMTELRLCHGNLKTETPLSLFCAAIIFNFYRHRTCYTDTGVEFSWHLFNAIIYQDEKQKKNSVAFIIFVGSRVVWSSKKKVKHKSDEIFSINLFVAGIIEMETGSKVCVLCALATNDNNDRCEANIHTAERQGQPALAATRPKKCV